MIVKPPKGAMLNRGHPLSRGLVDCYLLNEGSGNKVRDLSGNGDATTDAAWTAGPQGPMLSFNGSSQELDTNRRIPAGDDWTIVCSFKAGATSGTDYLIDSSNGSTGIMFRSANWTNDADFYTYKTGPTAVATAANRNYTADYQQLGLTRNNKEQAVYIDGRLFAGPTALGASVVTGNADLMFGADYNSGNPSACDIEYIYIYDRVLTSSEIQQLYIGPFCMLEREPIELWVGSVGAGAPPSGNAGIMTPNTGFWGATF